MTAAAKEIPLAVHGVFDFVVQSFFYTWQAAIDDELHHNRGLGFGGLVSY